MEAIDVAVLERQDEKGSRRMEIEVKIGARRYIFDDEESVEVAQAFFALSGSNEELEDELEANNIDFSFACGGYS